MNISPVYNKILAEDNITANQSLYNYNKEINNLENDAIDDASNTEGSSFKEIIGRQIDAVNQKQLEADKANYDFISGEIDDLHTVMIATEEARLSLELAVQIRNKFVEAYKELNNMQL